MSNGAAKSYRYTKHNNYLTEEERNFYEENGYIIKKNLVDHDLLDQCEQRFSDICEGRIPKRQLMILVKDIHLKKLGVRGEKLIDKIQHIVYDDVFFKYLSYEPLVNVVESFLGPNICTFHHMLINKPPKTTKVASIHPLHQDLQYFPVGPEDSVVAAWTPLQKVDTSNGCLQIIPGSHKSGLLDHTYPENGRHNLFQEVAQLPKTEPLSLEMEKGDTVFFHPLLIHGSGANLTENYRKALTAHYIDSAAGYFEDIEGTNRGALVEEFRQLNIKLGFPSDSKDYFRYKTRLIRGEPGNFQFPFLNSTTPKTTL